jgi:tRNA1(Val) A37 N6-methylase TrmN6
MNTEHTTLLNGRVKLLQQAGGLRASTDTVLLAAAVDMKPTDTILDMGCATGGVGLCVLERLNIPYTQLTGVDIQSNLIDLAQQNAADATYICGDVTDTSLFDDQQFDHIVMNPPYFETGKKQSNPDEMRDLAFNTDNFEGWMKSALRWVKHGGSVNIIHKADALDDILNFAAGRFGDIQIWPVYSNPSKSAIRVLVSMKRNRKSPMVVNPPVFLFDENGNQSVQSQSVLRDGNGIRRR